jgi:hypothetical protein
MAALTVNSVTAAGFVPAYVSAAGGGDTIDGTTAAAGRVFIHVKNGGSSMTVTIADPGLTPLGNAGSAAAVTVGGSAEKMIYIPPAAVNASTGVVNLTYSAVTSVTIGAFRI